jgi:hypothetical protein
MNKFSAEKFYQIASSLSAISELVERQQKDHKATILPESGCAFIGATLIGLKKDCDGIGLRQSSKCADRIMNKINAGVELATVQGWLTEIHDLIKSELEDSLFLWVPNHRSEWYSKDTEGLLGAECCDRFKSITQKLMRQ